MDKLMNNPEALSAISNLMAKMQENGIDLKSGERPSMAELAKLAVKEDVREATAKGELLVKKHVTNYDLFDCRLEK